MQTSPQRIRRPNAVSHHGSNVPGRVKDGRNSTETPSGNPHERTLGSRTNTATTEGVATTNSAKYALLRKVQRLKFTHTGSRGYDVPDRVNYCGHALAKMKYKGANADRETGDVGIYRKREGHGPGKGRPTRFDGVYQCKNLWACAVCSSLITAGRAEEVCEAMTMHYNAGHETPQGTACYMITYTFSHHEDDDVQHIVKQMLAACRRFKSGGDWTRWKQNMCYIGSISALETTWGNNGFHPHRHEVFFMRQLSPLTLQLVENYLNDRWVRILQEFGLTGIKGLALRMEQTDATGYISKYARQMETWGGDRELLMSRFKKGSGLTPWEILSLSDDPEWAYRYCEYYRAFKGRKQLHWSPGLKKRFLIPERSDAEIMHLHDLEYEKIGSIPWMQYEALYARGGADALGMLLDKARTWEDEYGAIGALKEIFGILKQMY